MAIPPELAEIIRRKKSHYGRIIDTKRWDAFPEVVAPDANLIFYDTSGAVMKMGQTPLAFSSAAALTSGFAKMFASAQTLHMFGIGELEQTAPGEIKAIWSMEDQLIMGPAWAGVEIRGGGYYYETWVKRDGDWFLKSLRLERTYMRMSFLARAIVFLQDCFGVSFV